MKFMHNTAATLSLLFASSAFAQDITIIYTNVAGHPTNVAPGTGGLPFSFSATGTTTFVRANVALDGQWVLEVDIDSGGTTDDNAYVRNGVLVIREGDDTLFAPGETWGSMDDNVGINSFGEIVLTNNVNGTAATTADDVVVLIDAMGNQTLLAREGDDMSAVLGAGFAGVTWDDNMNGPIATEAGTYGWIAEDFDGAASGTAMDEVCVLDGMVAYQKGVVAPGQLGGTGTETFENFDFQDFHTSLDGTMTLMQGDLSGPTASDDYVAINGTIAIQEGFVLPGSGFMEPVDLNGIFESWMDHGGNWYARGDNDVTDQDWVVRNGAVVAMSQAMQEIVPGSGEHWDDTEFTSCFYAFDGNTSGDYIIGGVTDAPTDFNGVLVLYTAAGGAMVVAREGDPIDLDCNGMFDDDAFIRTFGNDDCLLLEDGSILASITMRDSTLTGIGAAFVRIGAPTASCTVDNGTGANALALSCGTDPRLGKDWVLDVALDPSTTATACFLSFAPSAPISLPPFGANEFLIDFSLAIEIPPAAVGTHLVSMPAAADQFWWNRPLFTQAFRLDFPGGVPTLTATNRIDAIVGF